MDEGEPGRTVEPCSRTSSSASTVAKAAAAHHGPVARLLLGDVGRGVVRDAPCPVAVAPRGFREVPAPVRRVAVGFDGSDEARCALALAAQLAEDRGAALTVHTAWDIPGTVYGGGMGYTPDLGAVAEAERSHATEVLEAALADLPRAQTRVTRGRSSEVLEAAAHDADVLVVGSRRWGIARRVALGSTSDHLVHHATCPVIVVPRPAAADRAQADMRGPANNERVVRA